MCAKVTQTLSESFLRQGARDPLDQSAVGKVLGTGNSLRAEVMMSGKADDRLEDRPGGRPWSLIVKALTDDGGG